MTITVEPLTDEDRWCVCGALLMHGWCPDCLANGMMPIEPLVAYVVPW
jgi:hypothetical protein